MTKAGKRQRKPYTYQSADGSLWTKPRCRKLRKLWKDGVSLSQIATALGDGFTRSSVAGKVRRLKLPARQHQSPKANYRYNPTVTPPPRVMRKKRVVWRDQAFIPGVGLPVLPEMLPGDMEALKGNAWAPLPGSEPKPLLDVAANGGCRWPIGEERPFTFCGQPVSKGSYCAAHRFIAYRAAPPKQVKVKRASGINILSLEDA